jgi:hypothetical protein
MKHKAFQLYIAFAALGAAALPVLALAQYTPGSFMYFDHLAFSTSMSLTINPAIDDLNKEKDTVEEPPKDILKFAFSLPKRKATIQAMIDATTRRNAGSGKMLKAVIQDQDIFKILESALKSSDYQMNDMADALGFYWVASWSVANDKIGVNSRTQMLAVRDQAETKLRSMPSMYSMSDEGKQALAETLYLNALVLVIQHNLVKSDPAAKADITASARQGSIQFGRDPMQYRLTEFGFQLK